MKTLKYKLTGTAGLIQHSAATADPSNKFTKQLKEISGKRKKTEEDYENMSKIEWRAGLYVDNGVIVIPGNVIEAAFVSAAKSQKKGKTAQAGVFCNKLTFPLDYEGPKDISELEKREDFKLKVGVKVQMAKVIRTRPIFPQWSCEIELNVDTGLFNENEVTTLLKYCGESVGIGDWRPKYGRFTVEKMN